MKNQWCRLLTNSYAIPNHVPQLLRGISWIRHAIGAIVISIWNRSDFEQSRDFLGVLHNDAASQCKEYDSWCIFDMQGTSLYRYFPRNFFDTCRFLLKFHIFTTFNTIYLCFWHQSWRLHYNIIGDFSMNLINLLNPLWTNYIFPFAIFLNTAKLNGRTPRVLLMVTGLH